MDTGAVRPFTTIIHDPPIHRDVGTGSAVATDMPTEKTVRAAQSADTSLDDARRRRDAADRPAIRTGFERDLSSGSIVYRWTDETVDRVILEIPRSDRIRSRQAYEASPPAADGSAVDRSV